ncbi:MAG: VOC family protein [Acidobacteria bacterium]|nr:VOC family protein [Acidobacteriota bacterium]
MPEQKTTCSTAIPGMQYRNAPDAIEWLCRVFGFEKRVVHAGPDNTIMHAELTLGGGMIMLGSVNDKAPDRHMKLPAELGGAQTRGVSLIVKDADEVYARAKAAGAKIVENIEDKPFGGRGFACLDLEGHIWHVGTYDPWAPR